MDKGKFKKNETMNKGKPEYSDQELARLSAMAKAWTEAVLPPEGEAELLDLAMAAQTDASLRQRLSDSGLASLKALVALTQLAAEKLSEMEYSMPVDLTDRIACHIHSLAEAEQTRRVSWRQSRLMRWCEAAAAVTLLFTTGYHISHISRQEPVHSALTAHVVRHRTVVIQPQKVPAVSLTPADDTPVVIANKKPARRHYRPAEITDTAHESAPDTPVLLAEIDEEELAETSQEVKEVLELLAYHTASATQAVESNLNTVSQLLCSARGNVLATTSTMEDAIPNSVADGYFSATTDPTGDTFTDSPDAGI